MRFVVKTLQRPPAQFSEHRIMCYSQLEFDRELESVSRYIGQKVAKSFETT